MPSPAVEPFDAMLDVTEPMGMETLVYFTVDGTQVCGRVDPAAGAQSGQPMALARVGIPAGLTFQTWQLKEPREKGLIDFYETRTREVILYWRALPPAAKKDIDLDLIAATPGMYEAPATSAYLYYTAEDRRGSHR